MAVLYTRAGVCPVALCPRRQMYQIVWLKSTASFAKMFSNNGNSTLFPRAAQHLPVTMTSNRGGARPARPLSALPKNERTGMAYMRRFDFEPRAGQAGHLHEGSHPEVREVYRLKSQGKSVIIWPLVNYEFVDEHAAMDIRSGLYQGRTAPRPEDAEQLSREPERACRPSTAS